MKTETNLRDFVLETYEDLRVEIENGDYQDAFVTGARRDSQGNCMVFVDAVKEDGKKTLLIFKEWDETDSWKNILESMV